MCNSFEEIIVSVSPNHFGSFLILTPFHIVYIISFGVFKTEFISQFFRLLHGLDEINSIGTHWCIHFNQIYSHKSIFKSIDSYFTYLASYLKFLFERGILDVAWTFSFDPMPISFVGNQTSTTYTRCGLMSDIYIFSRG